MLRVLAPAGKCLSSRCLAMGLYVTVCFYFSHLLVLAFIVGDWGAEKDYRLLLSHILCFHHSDNIRRGVQIMKLLIT
jgi:hypothetical protein